MKKLTDYIAEAEQTLAEKAVSQQQQKFMGMVHSMQKGKKVKGASPELRKVARTMGKKDAEDFASTKHQGLPKKVEEDYSDTSSVVTAIVRRIMVQRLDLLEKYGPAKVMAAVDDVADFVGDVDEIGSSDVSGWIRQVERSLGHTNESSLDEVSLGDYTKKAGLSQALSKMEKGLGYPGNHDAKIARRAKGLARAKARTSAVPKPAPARVDRSELEAKLAGLEKQFDPSYEYSDDYTFWSNQKDIKNAIQSLRQQLANVGESVTESTVLDESGQTIGHILSRFKHEVRNFRDTGNLDNDLFDALYDYYNDHGEMPYGVAKARTGDPHNWISDRLDQHLQDDDIKEAASMVDIPAYKRKHNSRLGNFPAPMASSEPVGHTRPENVPAVARKAAGTDFPVSLDQVHDTSDKLTSMDTLRKMAGLPPRA